MASSIVAPPILVVSIVIYASGEASIARRPILSGHCAHFLNTGHSAGLITSIGPLSLRPYSLASSCRWYGRYSPLSPLGKHVISRKIPACKAPGCFSIKRSGRGLIVDFIITSLAGASVHTQSGYSAFLMFQDIFYGSDGD